MLQVDQKGVAKETMGAELMLVGKFFCVANTISKSQRNVVKQRVTDGWSPPDS